MCVCKRAMNKNKGKLILADTFHPLRDFIKANVRILFCKKCLYTRVKLLLVFQIFRYRNAHKYSLGLFKSQLWRTLNHFHLLDIEFCPP